MARDLSWRTLMRLMHSHVVLMPGLRKEKSRMRFTMIWFITCDCYASSRGWWSTGEYQLMVSANWALRVVVISDTFDLHIAGKTILPIQEKLLDAIQQSDILKHSTLCQIFEKTKTPENFLIFQIFLLNFPEKIRRLFLGSESKINLTVHRIRSKSALRKHFQIIFRWFFPQTVNNSLWKILDF